MKAKFDPAPIDKHAAKDKPKPHKAGKQKEELDDALEQSFPASDPVSAVQPASSKGVKTESES
jgi:hypothetical protein